MIFTRVLVLMVAFGFAGERAHSQGGGEPDPVRPGGSEIGVRTVHPMTRGTSRLYWSDLRSGEILRLSTDTPAGPWNRVLDTANPLGIALDQSFAAGGGKIYWAVQILAPPLSRQTADAILRADLDGSNIEVIVEGLDAPIGVALDLVNRKVYWADHGRGAISRANLDGSDVVDVLTGLSDPIDIALDVSAGRMYWTDHDGRRIRSADMNDGTGLTEIRTGGGAPQGIALDLARGRVYWTETTGDKIQCANLDLSSRDEVVSAMGFVDLVGLSIDVPDEVLYFGDYNVPRLQRYDISSGVLTDIRTDTTGPWDVELERETCTGSISLAPGIWQSLALPCQNREDPLRVTGLAHGDVELRVAKWDPAMGRTVEIPVGDQLLQGEGYWVMPEGVSQTISVHGVRGDTSQLFMIPLTGTPEGQWHLIGHPFDFDVAWSRVKVRHEGEIMTLAEADPVIDGTRACDMDPPHPSCTVSRVAHKLVGTEYETFDGETLGAEGRLEPWDAFWVRAYRDTTLLIPPLPADDLTSPTLEADGWAVELTVESGFRSDTGNLLGVLDGALIGLERHDLVELASPVRDSVSLAFSNRAWGDDSITRTTDFRAIEESNGEQRWTLEVHSSEPHREVSLSWEGPTRILARSRLVDVSPGLIEVIQPAQSTRYVFRILGTRHILDWVVMPTANQ